MSEQKKRRIRTDQLIEDVAFSLKRAAHPAPRTTVGDVNAFFRIRASQSFTSARVEIPYSQAAAKKVDQSTLRLFWWDTTRRSLVLVEPSGVDPERHVVWGFISEPGLYGAIGLPMNPVWRKTFGIFATFTAEELRARPELIPPVCGLILCADPPTFPGVGGLCEVCLGLEVPERHFPEVQIIHNNPSTIFKPEPPKLALPLWPTPNHDYRNTSQGDLDGPSAAPRVQWRFVASGLISPAVIGAGGTVYTATRDNLGLSVLYALDGTTGRIVWTLQLSSAGSRVSNPVPAVGPDGTIFVNAADGALCAVSPKGALLWRLPGSWGYPMPSPNGDVCNRNGSTIVAVRPAGAPRWSTPLTGIGSPVGAPRQVLAVRDDGSILVAGESIRALDAATGAVLWEHRRPTPYNVQAPLVVAGDGRILFNDTTNGIQVLSSTGALQTPLGWLSFEFAVAATGITYLRPAQRNAIVAVDRNGAALWTNSFSGPTPGPPVIGRNGSVYVSQRAPGGSQGPHALFSLDPRTGAVQWAASVPVANSTSSAYPIAIGLTGQLIITDVVSEIAALS